MSVSATPVWYLDYRKIREKLYRKKEVEEKTNLTVEQMVTGGNEVKGQVIFNNWEILK